MPYATKNPSQFWKGSRSVSKRLASVAYPRVPGPKPVNTQRRRGADSLAFWIIPSWNSVTTRLKTRCAPWQSAARTGSTSEASKQVLGWPPLSRSLKPAADCRFRCANISASYSLAWRTSQQIGLTNLRRRRGSPGNSQPSNPGPTLGRHPGRHPTADNGVSQTEPVDLGQCKRLLNKGFDWSNHPSYWTCAGPNDVRCGQGLRR